MPTPDPNQEDRQNPGLPHDAGRHGEAETAGRRPRDNDDKVRDGVPSVGRGLDEDTGSPTSSGFGV